MKRGIVFYAVAYAVSFCAYWLALRSASGIAESLDTPGWWMRLFRDPFKSINAWNDLKNILGILVASVPVGLALGRFVGRHAILIALGSAVTLCAVFIFPWFILVGWRAPHLFDSVALATVALAPALSVALTTLLPSNNRWRVS